jgi:hypothetical protein
MLARLYLCLAFAGAPVLALAQEAQQAAKENPGYGALIAVVVLVVFAVVLFLSFKKRPPRQQSTPRT